MELRINEQLGVKLAIAQVDADVRSGQKTAEYMHLAVGVADSQLALADEAPKQIGQSTHVAVLRGRPISIAINRKGITWRRKKQR